MRRWAVGQDVFVAAGLEAASSWRWRARRNGSWHVLDPYQSRLQDPYCGATNGEYGKAEDVRLMARAVVAEREERKVSGGGKKGRASTQI